MCADHRQPKLLPTSDYQMMQTVIKARYAYVSMKMSCILLDGLHVGSLVAIRRWTPRLSQHNLLMQVDAGNHICHTHLRFSVPISRLLINPKLRDRKE
jgi:hypothetical protein